MTDPNAQIIFNFAEDRENCLLAFTATVFAALFTPQNNIKVLAAAAAVI